MNMDRLEKIAALAETSLENTESIINAGYDDQSGQATPEEHQEWLDGASDEEIAAWVRGYQA